MLGVGVGGIGSEEKPEADGGLVNDEVGVFVDVADRLLEAWLHALA